MHPILVQSGEGREARRLRANQTPKLGAKSDIKRWILDSQKTHRHGSSSLVFPRYICLKPGNHDIADGSTHKNPLGFRGMVMCTTLLRTFVGAAEN